MRELGRIRPEIEEQVARLKKEDMKLAEVLCVTLGTILVDVDYPILKAYPSLRPVDILGKKYKNAKYCVVRYNKNSGSNDIVKSGILPEDAVRALAEIENKFPKDQDSFFSLELEDCLPSVDN